MVVICRIDLDKFDLDRLTAFVREGIVTIAEASESRAFKALTEYEQLMRVRMWQKVRG